MPPKKQKTISPKDAHFNRLEKVQTELGMLGAVLVVGVNAGSDDEGSDDDEREYTAEEIPGVELPTGRPLVFEFSDGAKQKSYYLGE